MPRIFLHPWHIEKCSCEEEYEYLQCYWKFGGATCYLGNYGRRFLSMLIKTLKDSEESLRTTLLGFKEKKKSKNHQAINLGIYLEEEDEEEKKALLFVS